MELLIARNSDPDRTLPYLLWLPIADGLVFRTKGTWPRTAALYCHPVPVTEWPEDPEIVERISLRACERRGAAIDVVAERGREQRSQIVFTKRPGPRDGVLAVPTYPQAGPARRAAPHGTSRRHRRTGDHGRHR